jgi:ribosomal protein S1
MYNRKKKFKCVIIDIMTEKEAIAKVIAKLEESTLFKCPESNNIDTHNKNIIKFLKNMYCPIEEEFLESSIITDFSD